MHNSAFAEDSDIKVSSLTGNNPAEDPISLPKANQLSPDALTDTLAYERRQSSEKSVNSRKAIHPEIQLIKRRSIPDLEELDLNRVPSIMSNAGHNSCQQLLAHNSKGIDPQAIVNSKAGTQTDLEIYNNEER